MSYELKPINEIKGPMNKDYLGIENSEGMPGLVDSTIALNFLLNVKNGIRNFAIALTEIADPEARREIRSLLNAQIELHVQVTELMIGKGWFHPYHVTEQFKLDNISAQTALQIANLQLFPGDTGRLGTFATPNY
jgi:spore coat protein CotF